MYNLPPPTQEQLDIYSAIEGCSGSSLAVDAKAGTGKTTTIIGCEAAFPRSSRLLAFNKDAADNLSNKLAAINSPFKASTFHSLGFGILRERVRGIKSDLYRVRVLKDKLRLEGAWKSYADLIDAYMTAGCGLPDFVAKAPTLFDLVGLQDIQVPEELSIKEFVANADKILKAMLEDNSSCTFSEMLYKPLYLAQQYKWNLREYSHLIVDEAQDVSPLRMALMKAMAPNAIAVGDPDQAIYGFAGSTAFAFSALVKDYNMAVYPLSVSWRCSQAVIAEACSIIGPNIFAAPGAAIGAVNTIEFNDFHPEELPTGDAVICRTNAPLFKLAIRLLKTRTPFVYKGDAVERILYLMRKFQKEASGVFGFMDQLDMWREQQEKQFQGRRGILARIADQYECIADLVASEQSVQDAIALVERILKSTYGLTLTTIHRAKGQEYDNVWLIRPDQIPAPWVDEDNEVDMAEERNCHYVAVTRAKNVFTYVDGKF